MAEIQYLDIWTSGERLGTLESGPFDGNVRLWRRQLTAESALSAACPDSTFGFWPVATRFSLRAAIYTASQSACILAKRWSRLSANEGSRPATRLVFCAEGRYKFAMYRRPRIAPLCKAIQQPRPLQFASYDAYKALRLILQRSTRPREQHEIKGYPAVEHGCDVPLSSELFVRQH
ncbi:hypothetical protein BV25DRAFT_703935 [Artomyces pyxidatus]|uniref:Uncharacterized protein n=1 Tax=Artomyces pyxidatus TaxID=48021 RepID=A0ACB8T015_9AGAM|nr:hypothetical protein BV25DRAFT_703935 [Artomyces pyxidatus]